MNTTSPMHVVLALAASFALASCAQESGTADDPEPTSSASSTSSAETPASDSGTVELTADGSTAGKCAMPSAETLAGFDTAFEGTVTSLDDGTATLAVDQWFAGGDGVETVTVTTPSELLEDLLLAVEFQPDRTYLVSADGGRVTLCGFSAEKSPELEALYQSAFAS
ncbi:MAG: hypothetical protein LH477_06520 [Nocardioides sp.]|nr:hypothetical protein [Nocardioides sp.]